MYHRLLPLFFILIICCTTSNQAFAVVKKTNELNAPEKTIVKKKKLRPFKTLRLVMKELRQHKKSIKKNKKARGGDLMSDKMFVLGAILFLVGMGLAIVFSLISLAGILSGLAGVVGAVGLILVIIALIRYLL